jgi:hypothetical protein
MTHGKDNISPTILWRRLDAPGHDACRLMDLGDAWRIEGAAVFRQEAGATALAYEVDCDRDWRTREGRLNGWAGSRRVDIRITRSSNGLWTLNSQVVPGIQECVDLDLGFTPATNLSQLRRIALQVGQSADVPVAWLDAPFGSLELLRQRYEHRRPGAYWYTAPRFGYAAMLEVSPSGFVQLYPSLWEAEIQQTGVDDAR